MVTRIAHQLAHSMRRSSEDALPDLGVSPSSATNDESNGAPCGVRPPPAAANALPPLQCPADAPAGLELAVVVEAVVLGLPKELDLPTTRRTGGGLGVSDLDLSR